MLHFLTQTLLGQSLIGYLLLFVVPLLLPVLFVKLVGFKGLRNLFSYEPKQTLIHRLDPRLKVAFPVIMGVMSVMLNWNYVYLLFAFTLIPWIILRPSSGRVRVLLTMVGVPAVGVVWSQGMFHTISTPGTITPHLLFAFPWTLNWLGTPGLSSSGMIYGAEQAGRTLIATSSSLLLILTTKPSDIIWACTKFGLPAPAGFALSVALRFLPQLLERLTVLMKAMEVRGYNFRRPCWWQVYLWPDYLRRVCVSIPTVTVPLLIGSLRGTGVMAMVADARAFGSSRKRTMLREHQATLADRLALGTLIVVVLSGIVLIGAHVGNRQV
ncbi:MAG: ABC-type cobalt transport system, permease component CbiQ [Bacilli bacterium]|nr:ABC-type cobalt transport system, permease component CbiQ [Bacilli bacterium]